MAFKKISHKTIQTCRSFNEQNVMFGVVLWSMIISLFVGSLLLRIVPASILYICTSIIATISIGISIVFYGRSPPTGLAVCLLTFYVASTISLAIPDIALLEISKIRYNESVLAIGYFVEIIPIAVLQMLQVDAHILTDTRWYTDKYFEIVVVSSIVVLLVTSLIFLLHMPDTHNMSLLQIQNALLKHESYFAFKFDKTGSKIMARMSTESSSYLVNEANNLNVIIQQQERSMTQSSVHSMYSDSSQAKSDALPPPPVNNTKSFDYNSHIPQPISIIPRANLTKISVNEK